MNDHSRDNRPAEHDRELPTTPGEEQQVPRPLEKDRAWPLTDPMRIVRADRSAASARIQRSIVAWRKPADGASSASQPKIFLVKKNGQNDDDGKKDGTPGNNRAQNRQFADAVKEIEKKIGRGLSADDRRKLHDAITGQNMGFHEIVAEGISLFGHK